MTKRRKFVEKKIILVAALVILGLQILFNVWNKQNSDLQISPTVTPVISVTPIVTPDLKNKQLTKIIRIVDGDTIVIEGGQKVRYIGVDTPELKHANKKLECFGLEAKEKNTELVLNKNVYMEKDVSEKDKFGRLLRYVWVDNVFVNDYLVRNGYAYIDTFPPDVKYAEQFRNAQKEARENKRGLWNKCKILN